MCRKCFRHETNCAILIEAGADAGNNIEYIPLIRKFASYPYGPDGVLATLADAFPYTPGLFSEDYEPGELAAAIIRAWKKKGSEDISVGTGSNVFDEWHIKSACNAFTWVYVIRVFELDGGGWYYEPPAQIHPLTVDVYDCHNLDEYGEDGYPIVDRPTFSVELSKAKEAGLKWSNGDKKSK